MQISGERKEGRRNSHFLVTQVQMRDYFNEVQVMRALNSGTARGKVLPCPGSSQNKSDLSQTQEQSANLTESLPGFNTQLRAGVIPSLLSGEVRRGG